MAERNPDGAVQQDPASNAAPERQMARYWLDGSWLGRIPQGLWRRHADAVHRELLERWLPEGIGGGGPRSGRALKTDLYEEAVGSGQTDWLAERCGTVAGVDLTPAVVAAAVGPRPRLVAAVADIRQLPFRDASFDLVVSLSTLDHFPDSEAIPIALAELARVLRPGGLLVLTLDNPANPILKLRQALPFPLLRRLGVVPYFCGPSLHPRQLPAALGAAGFEVEDLTAVLHCPRVLAVGLAGWLERLAPAAAGDAFLRGLRVFERLGRLPTRYLTGYFVAARCVRRA